MIVVILYFFADVLMVVCLHSRGVKHYLRLKHDFRIVRELKLKDEKVLDDYMLE